MSEYTKHLVPRPELRERIIDTAVEAFSAHGIKSITMDDIATSLGISKRTLYAIHQFAKRQMTWFRGMERRGFILTVVYRDAVHYLH